MGKEANCTLRLTDRRDSVRSARRLDGSESEGKAQLETDFLLFRGTSRLRIPFADMKKVEVKGSELRVRFPGGLAVFELGPVASAWAQAILHPKGRIEKLGVKDGMRVALKGVLDHAFVAEVAGLSKKSDVADADIVFAAAATKKDLASLAGLARTMGAKAAVWVVYPKGKDEIREGDVIAAGRAAAMTDIKVVRFSDTHTALKFVKKKS